MTATCTGRGVESMLRCAAEPEFVVELAAGRSRSEAENADDEEEEEEEEAEDAESPPV